MTDKEALQLLALIRQYVELDPGGGDPYLGVVVEDLADTMDDAVTTEQAMQLKARIFAAMEGVPA